MRPWWIVVAIAACGPATGPTPATPRARAPRADGTSWVQFEPMSTYLCARLPDGQVRAFSFGVGTGFVLQPGHELELARRDAICGPRDAVVLGARGELAYASEKNDRSGIDYQVLAIEPRARAVGWVEAPCWLDDAGALSCVVEPKAWQSQLVALFDAQGPIREMLRGSPCALFRDGRVLCATTNGPPALIPMWTDAKQASVVPLGWSQYGGCAVLRSGRVSCVGENWLGQRGFLGKVDARVASEVPGLGDVDEVSASARGACALRGGEVWCWGSAGQRAAGDAAYDASRAIPACRIDRAATEAARRELERAQKICSDPNRRHEGDDPFCRSMWRATSPGPIFEGGGVGCDPTQHGYYRWAPPTRVLGIEDAVAVGTNGVLSCAVRASGAVTCWGAEQKGTRTIRFPPRAPVPPPPPAVTVERRGLYVSVGDKTAIVGSASGGRVAHALDKTVGPPVALDADVVDALASPRVCALHAGGRVTCEDTGGWNPGFPAVADGVRLSTISGQGCVLAQGGVLHCGPTAASNWESTRDAALLSAAEPIADAEGRCALGADRVVRCALERGKPPRVVWTHVAELAMDAGDSFGCAVQGDGAVACSGTNYTFQRGDGNPRKGSFGADVTPVAGLPPVDHVAVSTTHACAIAKDGSVWCWGRATEGETGAAARAAAGVEPQCAERQVPGCETPDGFGPTRRLARPTRVPGLRRALAIAASSGRTCVVTEGAELACFGRGMNGVQVGKTRVE